MKIHPLCKILPDMTADEFSDLVEGIRENGLIEVITTLDDQILDGRHRYQACRKAGVEPRFKKYSGSREGAAVWVFSKNVLRRHLTTNQRDMAAARLATMGWGEKKADAPIGATTQKEAAKLLGASRTGVQRARRVLESGDPDLIAKVDSGEVPVSKAAAQLPKKTKPATEAKPAKAAFNHQENESIDWAKWSWNPVTGCEHGCNYCYARDIADRFYPQKFKPTFHADRLEAPGNMKVPAGADADISLRNVFTVSMGDLFGKWVPVEWITSVLDVVEKSPQWNFLFLTKNPKRYSQFSFPKNAWVGTTVDCQSRVAAAERAFENVDAKVKWLSVEPMLTPLKFSRLDLFRWLVIGGASHSAKTPEWRVPADWWAPLHAEARALGLRVYHKTNLYSRSLELDFPGAERKKVSAPAVFTE